MSPAAVLAGENMRDLIINGSEKKGKEIFFDNAKTPLKLYLLNRIKENRTKKLRPIFQRLEKKFDIEKYFNRWRLNKPKRNMEEELIRKINGTNDMVDNTYLILKQYFFNQSQDPLKDFLSSKIRVKRLKKMRPIVKRKTKPIDIEKYFNRWRLKPDLNEQLIRKIKGMNTIVKGSEDLHKRIDFVNVEKPLKRYLYNIIQLNRRRKLRAIVNHYDKEFDIEKYFNRWRLGRDISKDIKDANEELLRKMKGFNIILLNTEKTAKQSSLDTVKPPVEDYLKSKIKVTRTKRMRPIVKRKIQPIDIEKYFNRWRLGRNVDSEKAQAEDALKRKIMGINLIVNGGDKKGQRVGLNTIKDKLMKYFGTVIRTRRVKIIRPIVKKKDQPIDIEKYFNRWRLGRDVDGERNKAEEAIRRRIKGTNLIIYGVNKTAKRKGLKSAYPPVKKSLLPKIFGQQIKHLKTRSTPDNMNYHFCVLHNTENNHVSTFISKKQYDPSDKNIKRIYDLVCPNPVAMYELTINLLSQHKCFQQIDSNEFITNMSEKGLSMQMKKLLKQVRESLDWITGLKV